MAILTVALMALVALTSTSKKFKALNLQPKRLNPQTLKPLVPKKGLNPQTPNP